MGERETGPPSQHTHTYTHTHTHTHTHMHTCTHTHAHAHLPEAQHPKLSSSRSFDCIINTSNKDFSISTRLAQGC
jgi:hypothetical protein